MRHGVEGGDARSSRRLRAWESTRGQVGAHHRGVLGLGRHLSAKRTPTLAHGYRKVLGVVEARNAKVAAGIESSKAARKAEAKTG